MRGITDSGFIEDILKLHNRYMVGSLSEKRIKYKTLYSNIHKFKSNKLFSISCAGKSVEGREINLIRFGSGKIKIFCWSQMHGDESTATMALLDLLYFFESDHPLKNFILSECTIYFLPMLNPDGAEVFERRNSLQIDLNRDAIRLVSPEAQILKKLCDEIKPEFGFNLHDQNIRYSVGYTNQQAALSFLAPAYNREKSVNETRFKSMQLIAALFDSFRNILPDRLARYDDEFEPRAFGDNIMKWGISTILIESGGWPEDREKQKIRELNFAFLLTAFKLISDRSYNSFTIEDYQNIPENKELFFDLKLTNLKTEINSKTFILDIGINLEENTDLRNNSSYFKGIIKDIGDLSTFNSFKEIDCTGYRLSAGKSFPERLPRIFSLKELNFGKLHSSGYCSLVCDGIESLPEYSNLPFNIISSPDKIDYKIKPENPANFLICKDKTVIYLIINGFFIKPGSDFVNYQNGLIIK